MADQARQPAGAPTGGQFTTTTKTEADVALPAIPSVTELEARLDAATQAMAAAETATVNAGLALFAAHILRHAPEATHVDLEWADTGSGWQTWHVGRIRAGEKVLAEGIHELDDIDDERADELSDVVGEAMGAIHGPGHADRSAAVDARSEWNSGAYTGDVTVDLRAAVAAAAHQ